MPHFAFRLALALSLSLALVHPAPLRSQDVVSPAAPLAAGELRGRVVDSARLGWTARTNASLRATSTLDFQTLLFYMAPMTVEQGKVASRVRFSVAARKKLVGDQLNLALRVTDPFNASRELTTTIDPAFYQVTERRRVERGILLSANWTFGKPPKEHGRDEGGGDQGVADGGGK